MPRSRQFVWSKQRSHVATGDGMSRFLDVGEQLLASDPIVKMYPSMFTDDPTPFMRSPVSNRALETATADPGERRATNKRVAE